LLKGFKKRRLAVALSACMMMPSAAVHALGMGEIEVYSALNEPLNAEIKLLSATPEELEALKVNLASSDAFSRMGLDRLPVLGELEFEVIHEGARAPYIKVVSGVPIREPFLDFILGINWANGQMLREYTLLLDPPVFEEGETVAPIAAAVTESAQIDRGAERPAARSWGAPQGSYGPTSRSDTLWAVARDMRPDRSISVPQMMIALQKENPDAFSNNNINNLKAGYVLRAPQLGAINSLSKAQAANEANRQYQEWVASAGKTPAASGGRQVVASTDAAGMRPVVTPGAVAQSGARLKLLSPEEAGLVGGAGKGQGAAMEQLAAAMETAEATRQENVELKERLADLERQMQSIQRLLTLKGDTLGALQAGVGNEQQVPDVAVEQPEEAMPVDEAAIAPVPQAQPQPVVSPEPVVAPSLVDDILADPKLLAAAIGGPLLLILLVVAFVRRRREQAEFDEFDTYAVSGATPVAAGEDAIAVAEKGPEPEVATPQDEVTQESFGEVVSDPALTGFTDPGMGAIQAEESEIDPIAEADVYLAYRRYEQAEALLKEAIRADDGRNELKLKLLEIYFTTKDKDAFEAQVEALYAAIGGQEEDLWSQAVEMGREICPDHPLFAESGGLGMDDAIGGVEPDGNEGLTAESRDSDLVDNFDSVSAENESPVGEELNLSVGEQGDVVDDFSVELDAGDEVSLDDIGLSEKDFDGALDDLSDIGEFSLDSEVSTDTAADELLDLDASLEALGVDDELNLDDVLESEELAEGLESLENLDDGPTSQTSSPFEELGDDIDTVSSLDKNLDANLENTGTKKEAADTELALDLDAEDSVLDLDELGSGLGEELEDIAAELGDLSEGLPEADVTDKAQPKAEKLTEANDKWSLEPAVSSFRSRDIKDDETDNDFVPVKNVDHSVLDGHSLDHLSLDNEGEISSDLDIAFDEAVIAEPELADDLEEVDIFDSSDDIVGTKLDLARAYIEMGDQDGARSILDEVVSEGDDTHREEAQQLMQQIS